MQEALQGRKQADAAKAAGVRTFIFSGLLPIRASEGVVTTWVGRTNAILSLADVMVVISFGVKADIVDYARSLGGMSVKSICPGGFASNYWKITPPIKIGQDEYKVFMPFGPTTSLPIIDISHDFGRFVVAASREESPNTILAGSHYMTLAQLCEDMSEGRRLLLPIAAVMLISKHAVSGKNISFQELTLQQYRDFAAPYIGTGMAEGLALMYEAIATGGCEPQRLLPVPFAYLT